jgi:hypothetical protein
VIKLTVGTWSFSKKLDYEKITFKCWGCHEYGNFHRHCPQNQENQQEKEKNQRRQPPKKAKENPNATLEPRNEGKKNLISNPKEASSPKENHVQDLPRTSGNKFTNLENNVEEEIQETQDERKPEFMV